MPQSELLTTILNDYLAEKPVSPDARKEVEKFYEYATNWLNEKKPIGLGHSFGNGLSIRFTDGKELVMLADDSPELLTPRAVNITGANGGSVRGAGAIVDSSRSITSNNDY